MFIETHQICHAGTDWWNSSLTWGMNPCGSTAAPKKTKTKAAIQIRTMVFQQCKEIPCLSHWGLWLIQSHRKKLIEGFHGDNSSGISGRCLQGLAGLAGVGRHQRTRTGSVPWTQFAAILVIAVVIFAFIKCVQRDQLAYKVENGNSWELREYEY